MLLCQEHFHMLEQMLVAGKLLHDHAPSCATMCTQQLLHGPAGRWFDHPTCSPNLALINYHLFQHLKRFPVKHHFPSDGVVWMGWLVLLSGG
ncbi:hypothetical protein AVEN_262576-1 [Araneus ventricosus]|uniref:Uncharacterized protein n=1 Tax=Araneus ventricosus TaxID=182803 RepID=A0A4Y2GZA8_ARAVE|nr:hypothetical protein AVEN_262576-1 [Araneus ventricosus]